MIYVMGGGISNAYAVIRVTFPAGSSCTCSKTGEKTLTAKDTQSGKYIFLLPAGGNWTVSCTDGTKTASRVVSVSQYDAITVAIAYKLVVYDYGSQDTATTGGLAFVSGLAADFTFGTNNIGIIVQAAQNGRTTLYKTQNNLNLSNYRTVKVRSAVTNGSKYYEFSVSIRKSSDDSELAIYRVVQQTAADAVHSIDISGIGSALNSCYIQISAAVYSGDNNPARIDAVVYQIIAE